MTTGDRIKNRRLELGLTQLEVAKRLGLTTKAAVSKVEGQGDNVTLKNVEKFAKALNCPIPYLMGWEDEDNKSELNADDVPEQFKDYVDVINKYMQLSDQNKAVVDGVINSLSEK